MKDKINKKNSKSIMMPVMLTLISCGPIGWFFLDTLIFNRYDRIIYLSILSILLTCLSVSAWFFYFKYKNLD